MGNHTRRIHKTCGHYLQDLLFPRVCRYPFVVSWGEYTTCCMRCQGGIIGDFLFSQHELYPILPEQPFDSARRFVFFLRLSWVSLHIASYLDQIIFFSLPLRPSSHYTTSCILPSITHPDTNLTHLDLTRSNMVQSRSTAQDYERGDEVWE